jgi:hypothetical protein
MDIWVTVISIVSGVGTLAGAVAVIVKASRLVDSISARKEENTLIIKGLFAALDGLHQQGANGCVTKSRTELQEYIVKHRL